MSVLTQPTGRARVQSTGWGNFLRGVLSSQEALLFFTIVVLFIYVGNANDKFLARRNLDSIFQGNAYIAVAAIGMSMVIITRNIDISVGSLIGVLATIGGQMATHSFPIWTCWLVPVLLGMLVGAFNGFMVSYVRIPAIVVTLGMMSILKGGLILVTNGAWIYDIPTAYFLAQQEWLGIPSPVYFMVILTLLAALWMRYSATGRAIYAVGGNPEAARLSGIAEQRIIMTAFILNGMMVGISSVLFATQLNIIQSTVPPNLELFIITGTVIGGVSILGGTGTVIGAMLATILLRAIESALVFINISPFWTQAIRGGLILITMLIDMFRRYRQNLL